MRWTASKLLPLLAITALVAGACSRDTSGLEPEPLDTDGRIFLDEFGRGVSFQGFAGSNTNALAIDSAVHHTGIASLRITIPNPGDPAGGYSGGAFVAQTARDLSGFNALTFWARASRAATLNVAGLGNDNTGTSKYTAERSNIPLTTEWQKIVLPIPLAARLANERGLFFFAEGPEDGSGYQLWIDDVQFETVTGIGNPRPAIASATVTDEVGGTLAVTGTQVTYSVDGSDVTMVAMPGYFTFASNNTNVATIAADGAIAIVGAGDAAITASLGTTAATGTVTLHAVAAPAAAAPTPTQAASDVISLFSNAYTDVAVSTWSATWDQADLADVQVAGNATKKYTNLVFAGIEFTAPTIDASAMTHLHLDVYAYDATAFRVKLVDFGADGAFGGGDDTEHEVALSAGTTPAVTAGAWSSLDIPLSAFTGMARGHLAQMIISGSSATTYLDNIYFYKSNVVPPTAPTTAAPTPAFAAGDAIALFSNAYANRTVETWSAVWDNADVTDLQVAGNDTKKYTNLVFAGIEFKSPTIDASAMTHFYMHLWTPDATGAAIFKIKLVDFGADGAYAGGDDVEHELTLTASTTPALATGSWVTLDIPFTAFTGLTTRAHLAQMIISGDLRTVFVDNVLFHR